MHNTAWGKLAYAGVLPREEFLTRKVVCRQNWAVAFARLGRITRGHRRVISMIVGVVIISVTLVTLAHYRPSHIILNHHVAQGCPTSKKPHSYISRHAC